MSASCPHCDHPLKLKSVRAGRFQLKCSRCTKPFVLTVSGDAAAPKLTTAPVPASTVSGVDVTAPPSEPDLKQPVGLDATVAPSEGSVVNNPEFSVSPSIVKSKVSQPSKPAKAKPPAIDATVAPSEGSAVENADFSVSPSLVKSKVADNPDVTSALDSTSPPLPAPGRASAANLDATEAGDSEPPEEEEEEKKPKRKKRGEEEDEMPSSLGNYQVEKELGRGGMGAVYLARQVSLDRPVALKVMNSKWAKNPTFLVRFTREAYAAAQLVHHNVVQVYDIGADKGINYFSMEFVQGKSLGDLLKKEGRLDAPAAAGYVLQAARGLKFAHDRGMIHRDIKPDNLMLNDQGIVKVADLGLVRTPGMEDEKLTGADEEEEKPKAKKGKGSLAQLSNVTMAGQAMGTPSYMAPEQARDASTVDHRADIYSLGCTLYVMVTGRPVFTGNTAMEVMTKHASEPVVRPDLVVKDVPRGLGDVIVKMIAKKPDDRYQTMDETIKALEAFLGLAAGADQQMESEQHLRTLEKGVKAFASVSGTKLRSIILLGFFGGCAALFCLLLLLGIMGGSFWLWVSAGAVMALGVTTGLAYFVVTGLTKKGPLWLKVRDLLLSASWLDYAKIVLGLLLFAGVLWLLGLFAAAIFGAIFAVVLALALHFLLDRKVAAGQAEALEKVEHMLKTLRLRGISEEAVQEFVAKYSGDDWEEFFEALFGYETKLAAREAHGKGPKGNRPRYAGWREPIIRWIDAYQRRRQEAKERKHLEAIERANLVAQGISESEAKRKAEAVAEALVQVAADIRQQSDPEPEPEPVPTPAKSKKGKVVPGLEHTVAPEEGVDSMPSIPAKKKPAPRRVDVQERLRLAAEPDEAAPVPKGRSGIGRLFGLLFGGGLRFLLGAGLLAMSLLWLYSWSLLPGASNFQMSRLSALWQADSPLKPLTFVLVPEVVMQALCSVGALLSGMLLVVSAIWRSWKIGFAMLLATALMVIGPVSGLLPADLPIVSMIKPGLLWLVAGGVVAVLGFLFGRDT